MPSLQQSQKISHTRGVPLANLTGLCLVLGQSRDALSVKVFANEAIRQGVLDFEAQQRGERIDTRINHHMIALRALGLVQTESRGGSYKYYNLTATGEKIYVAAQKSRAANDSIDLTFALRSAWRPVLVDSHYVRHQWLKYFMPREDFDLDEFISSAGWVTLRRIAPEERDRTIDKESAKADSGYRLHSTDWPEQPLNEGERREIHQGLRLWTNDVYLTDDRVIEEEAGPFLHLSGADRNGVFEIESHAVKGWLDPERDLDLFEEQIHEQLDASRRGDRIAIPDLIIGLCRQHGYAKDNLKEMLTKLFYERGNNFFFVRGSKFLIDHAFKLNTRDQTSVYYLKLEGVWRTSIIRYGSYKKGCE